MRIQGDLATYELSDLLQWLAQGRKSGTLVVSDGQFEHRLGFDKGRIDMAASNDPARHLDRYLLKRGLIDEATTERAARLRDATKMLAGQVMVTLGVITQEKLAEVLRLKTEELVRDLLTWEAGSFEFSGDERHDEVKVPLGLDVTRLLLESMDHLEGQTDVGAPEPAAAPMPPPAATVATPPELPPTRVDPPAAQSPTEGLALAEVMDPGDPVKRTEVPLVAPEAGAVAPEVPAHYAAMARGPSAMRRLAPLALIVAAGLSAGGFYLANRHASAQAVKPAGKPILFTAAPAPPRPSAPPPEVPTPPTEVPAPPPVPSPVAPSPAAEPPPAATGDSPGERALRERYEAELADLRRELEEARQQATEPPPPAAAAPERIAGEPAEAEPVPADEPPTRVAAAALAEPGEPAAESEPQPAAEPRPQKAAPAPATLVAEAPAALEPAPREASREPGPQATARQRPVAEPARPDEPAAPESATRPAPPTVQRPSLVSRPVPRYPPVAQRHGHSGTVTLRLLVGKDGRVEEVERTGKKAGLGLDRAAEEAALASLWEPGTVAGEPAAMWTELRFEFRP